MPTSTLPTDVEAAIRQMFEVILEPFERAKEKVAPGRSSFLSYKFILRKFLLLLDPALANQVIPATTLEDLQRNAEESAAVDGLSPDESMERYRNIVHSLRQQDEIWREICAELSWEFSPEVALAPPGEVQSHAPGR